MKVLNTITVYKKDGQNINVNEDDRDKYMKEGWSEVEPEVKSTVKPTAKPEVKVGR